MQRKMSAWALLRLLATWAMFGHSCFSAEISLTGAIGDLKPHNLFVNGIDPEVPMQAFMASRQSDVWTLEITNTGSETWTEFQIRILGIPDAAASRVQFDSEDLPEGYQRLWSRIQHGLSGGRFQKACLARAADCTTSAAASA